MYSNKDMEEICLGLADKAEPLEAGALREVAKNYSIAAEPKPKAYELKLRHLFWLVVGISAIWTLVYLLIPHEVGEPPPEGRRVEQLGAFTKTPDGRFRTRTFIFVRGEKFVDGVRHLTLVEDPIPLVVHEGRYPLPKGNYELQELSSQNEWRFVTITTSDGSDPNKNGRRYFVVLP
jgi:hypothetical protein